MLRYKINRHGTTHPYPCGKYGSRPANGATLGRYIHRLQFKGRVLRPFPRDFLRAWWRLSWYVLHIVEWGKTMQWCPHTEGPSSCTRTVLYVQVWVNADWHSIEWLGESNVLLEIPHWERRRGVLHNISLLVLERCCMSKYDNVSSWYSRKPLKRVVFQ
jgi:hypothetical protein